MRTIIGAIFPISDIHANRIFSERKTVFAKYTIFKGLQSNSKILFYASKRRLVGEAKIERIEKIRPEVAWSNFGSQLFLNETEFNEYVSKSPCIGESRKMREITVFVLKSIKKYSPERILTYNITPAGCYLSKEEYDKIIQ